MSAISKRRQVTTLQSPASTRCFRNRLVIMNSNASAAQQTVLSKENPSSSRLAASAESCPIEDGESAAKYLFKLSHDVILSLDRDGNVLCINQRGVELSGYSESELHGVNIFELLLFPEEQQAARQMLADLIKGKAQEYQLRWRTKDGSVVHFDGISVPRLSDRGEFLSTLCTLRDVTERKSAEEKLRKSEEKYRDLIEISPDAIYVIDSNGICVLGNRAGAELAGISQDQLVGTPITDTYLLEERHLFRERLEKLKMGHTIRFERKFVRKNGEIVPVEVSVSAIRGGYFQAILRDVSERMKAEALQSAEKRVLEMIATGVPLKEILSALCLFIEEQRNGTLASVLLLNRDSIHLDCIAGPSLPKEWMQQMERLPIGPCAGSCGTAAYRGSPVIVSDIRTDPLWDVPEHRTAALKHGLRASWSNPVVSSKRKVLGTFCMYYREPRTPTSQDLELIELATHLVRVAIERDRAQEALRASEQVARGQVEALTYSLDVLATAPAPDKFLGQMLSTIGRLLDAQSVILWLLDESNDSLVLRAWAEGTNFVKLDSEHPFIKNPSSWKKDPGLREMFFSGAPVGCEDIDRDPDISEELREYLKAGGTKRFLRIPTLVGGQVKGFIGIRHGDRQPYRPEEIELAQALAHQAMLAIQLNEFAEQSRQAAVLEERTRMARDIHDTLAQGFTGVIIQMEAAEEALLEKDSEHAVGHVQRARELARDSLGEARRSVHALRPQALEKAAFVDALQAIVKNTAAGTSLRTEFRVIGQPRELAPAVEENLLHIGQEALTNALKHAGANTFQARLSFDSDAVYLELRDNGVGFNSDGMNNGGIGLIGMKERADQIGATLEVISEPGKGTKITAVSLYQSA
jgi:PAS domain S-box-containing protein